MTIDEAIKHAEEVADICEYEASKYDMSDSYESHVACQEGKCAEEHKQLAEWLKDYKRLLEQEPKTGCCEECKHFRKLPYHADTLGKCVHHTGFCPKGDWYCADYEIVEV